MLFCHISYYRIFIILVGPYFRRNNFKFKSTISFWIFLDQKNLYRPDSIIFFLLEQTTQSLLTKSSDRNSNTCVSNIKSSFTHLNSLYRFSHQAMH